MRGRKRCWHGARGAVARVFHPKGMTRLDCGFLALDDSAVKEAFRIQLSLKGVAGCPPIKELHCTKSLWIDSDLLGEDIFNELLKRRPPCKGFFPYRPGYSPSEHLALQDSKQARREKITIGILGALGGAAIALVLPLLTGWLKKYFSS